MMNREKKGLFLLIIGSILFLPLFEIFFLEIYFGIGVIKISPFIFDILIRYCGLIGIVLLIFAYYLLTGE